MKKGLITIILTFILIFNTYSPTFATTPDPAAAIPVTAYEVYTYFTLVLTYMGVEYKNSQERKQWLEDEYGPNTPTYQSVEDILRKAKINFSNEPPNYNPKPEPRQVAIPVPDNLIDNLINKLNSWDNSTPDLGNEDIVNFFDYVKNLWPGASYRYYIDNISTNPKNNGLEVINIAVSYTPEKFYTYPVPGNSDKEYLELSDGSRFNRYSYFPSNGNKVATYLSYFDYPKTTYIGSGSFTDNPTLFELPYGDFIRNWTSPYTGMQTVTMPLTTTDIEVPVEIPLIPDDYVEPVPDEVTNPIQNPENDPLINPETGLPFIDPETGLPIFPSTPLVPVTPITPIPQPEELTQPKDYTPNLTEISNGIKQLPERIINPIKKLFIPDKVSKIDFSPLNVPITKKFPFSIPFDLANMFQNFSAGGEPPKWDINLVFMDYSETVTIDLLIFEKWAEIIRFFVFIGFNIGLILVTRNLIRG